MPKLRVVELGETREVVFADSIVIGRDKDNGVVIQDPQSSRRHCQLERQGAHFFLEDLKSSNGTLLNGRRASRIELEDGDVIEIGAVAMTFLIEVGAAPAVSPAARRELEASTPASPVAPVARAPEVPRLTFLGGPRRGETLVLASLPFRIGRRPENDLVLNDRRVSGHHARLSGADGRVFVEDLESGNGVLVNGQRVQRQALASGDELSVGDSTFIVEGVRVPEKAATAERARAQDSVSTVAVRVPARASAAQSRKADEALASDDDFRRLSIERATEHASPLQWLWTGVFVLCFVATLYSGYLLITNQMERERLPVDPDNLLGAAGSFETRLAPGAALTAPGWSVAADGDPVSLDLVTGPGVQEGRQALEVRSGGGPRGYAQVVSPPFPVSSGQALRVAGLVQNQGFQRAGLAVLWLESTPEGERLAAVSHTPLIAPGSSYRNLSATVSVPSGREVALCRVAIFGLGSGRMQVDRVGLWRVSEAPAPPVSLRVSESGRTLSTEFRDDGTFSLVHERDTVLRNVRMAAPGSEGVPFGQLVAPSFQPPVRSDGGIVRSQFTLPAPGAEEVVEQEGRIEGDALRWAWKVVQGTHATRRALVIELDPRAATRSMTLAHALELRVEGGTLSQLAGATGDEWTIGEGGTQVTLSASQPVTFEVLLEARTRGVPTVLLWLPADVLGATFALEARTIAPREQRAIDQLLSAIEQARAEERGGEVLEGIAELTRRYPWRSDLGDRLDPLRGEVNRLGQQRLTELQEMRGELEAYPDSLIGPLLEERAEHLIETFAGTPIAGQAQQLLERVQESRASGTQTRQGSGAARLLERGEEHFVQHRNHCARFYFERILSEYPDTEAEETARLRLRQIEVRN